MEGSDSEATLPATLGDDTPAAEGRRVADERALSRGDLVGRYVVLERLGAGGMGVVYGAYDPELDRKLALKLLLPRASGQESQARLQREAQAMAKLSHANVVAVHDVGVHGDRVFVGMEFVTGQTLREWMAEGARPWQEVLGVFIGAGRGLAAAHEAGLIHRDFKPDNVMLTARGVPKVMDFGLARVERGEGNDDPVPLLDGEEAPLLEHALTRTGAVVGTPAYMAPEQFLGLDTDAKTDQFSFCVALYEALYGERPFAGDTLPALATSVSSGRIREVRGGGGTPAWLARVVTRGLAADPAQRWPNMTALLAELQHDPDARQRRWLAVAGVVVVLGAGAYGMSESMGGAAPCEDMARHLDGVWDEPRRAAAEAGIRESGVGFAASTWERVAGHMDRYTGAWVEQRVEACRATRVSGEQSERLMDARMACLDRRLHAVDSTVALLAGADIDLASRAIDLVTALPRLEACADAERLAARDPAPDDPAEAARVLEIEASLADVVAQLAAGKYREAVERGEQLVVDAREVGHAPTLAEVLGRAGDARREAGMLEEAEKLLREAYFLAVEHDLPEVAMRGAGSLAFLLGRDLKRIEDGQAWTEHALAHARGIGTSAALASSYSRAGAVASGAGRYEEAVRYFERVLELHAEDLPSDHPAVGTALHNLGAATERSGRYEEAGEHLRRALEIREAALGPDHPRVGDTLMRLGSSLAMMGKHLEAKPLYQRGLAIHETALGPDHPTVAKTLTTLANVASTEKKLDEARAGHERALAIWVKHHGPDHANVGSAHLNLGSVAYVARDMDTAAREYRRALELWEKSLGPDHPNVAMVIDNLGNVALGREQYAEALPYFERAVATRLKAHGADHPKYARALLGKGAALRGLGRHAEAIEILDRALGIWAETADDPDTVGSARWTLAQVLWEAPASAGRDRARARELARQAKADLERGGEWSKEMLGSVGAWLEKHGG